MHLLLNKQITSKDGDEKHRLWTVLHNDDKDHLSNVYYVLLC